MSTRHFRALVREAARHYPATNHFARHFASGKLGRDPVFRHILEQGLLSRSSRILDIGCGQGVVAALLVAARERHARGDWPPAWPDPPAPDQFHGIDLMPSGIATAAGALGSHARFTCADMRTAAFGEADAVVILDVLHYVDFAAQDEVLRRVREALRGGGTLLLRVAAKSESLRFRYTMWVDRVAMRLRGHRLDRHCCRSLAEWTRALEALGFRVATRPMSQGTWFANALLVATLPPEAPAPG